MAKFNAIKMDAWFRGKRITQDEISKFVGVSQPAIGKVFARKLKSAKIEAGIMELYKLKKSEATK